MMPKKTSMFGADKKLSSWKESEDRARFRYEETRRIIKRKCLCCGRPLKISVADKGKYSGGHYFGRVPILLKNHKYNVVRYAKIDGKRFGTFNLTGKEKKIEYRECNKCFRE